MDTSNFCPGLAFVVLNAVFLSGIFYIRMRMSSVNRWPSTRGMVFASGLEKQKVKDRNGDVIYVDSAIVHYSYHVGEKLYESTQVTFGPELKQKGIESPTVRYPTGAQVTVFYNPENPTEAVLERRAPLEGALWLILGLMDLMLGMIYIGSLKK